MQFKEIPYVRLTPTAEATALQILVKGNLLLRKWSQAFPKIKFRQFRNLVMSGKCPVNDLPVPQQVCLKRELPQMIAIRYNKVSELDNRPVEQSLMESLSCLAKKHAKRWSRKGDPKGITFSDYLQEAYMQVMESLYQYTDLEIEIGTYVWNCLQRRMINVTNQQGSLLSHLTNDDLKMLKNYEEVQRQSAAPLSFEAVVQKLGLTKEEADRLGPILTTVFTENCLERKKDSTENEGWNDYTGFRNVLETDPNLFKLDEEDSVRQILDKAKLTTMERKVIKQAMDNSDYGWQTKFAAQNINPETKEPYTRMRITQILKNARRKLAAVVEQRHKLAMMA